MVVIDWTPLNVVTDWQEQKCPQKCSWLLVLCTQIDVCVIGSKSATRISVLHFWS